MPELIVADRPTAAIPARAPAGGWLHCCNGLDPRRDGGMVPSILGMTGALARHAGPLAIVTPTPSRLDGTPVPADVTLLGPETDYLASIRRADAVHFHGLWQVHTRLGTKAARQSNVPYLMAAHGMAEPWALRHKALKKKVYTALVEGKNLRRASCLHALSRPEIGHLRAIAPRTPVCLVPNGVDLRPFDDLPARAELERDHPELAGKFVVLFFGRVHRKKGLDLLAKALGSIRTDHPDVHVLLAGLDDGALAPFLAQAEAEGVRDRITYVGHVSGAGARRVWGAADAFILPSYSEGFSMAILEALACRLPCLVTTACHFGELEPAGAALVVEPTEAGVTQGLRNLIEMGADQRAAMARNGRALVESRYTWDRQAERLAGVYRWVAGGGPAPEAVLDAREEAR
ncbi:glycosyltransferase [Tundrisphaera sp. TA3]|uniref:glycosyltransferase n=1 Tax=Tundrisphaera sp. TA3 TaxID=3435775 RepID=UPI003EB99552